MLIYFLCAMIFLLLVVENMKLSSLLQADLWWQNEMPNKATTIQCAKKVVSDSPGLVDFTIGLVFFVLNLLDGQVLFFGEIQITEGLLSILPIKKGFGASWNDLWASTCYLQLAWMAGCKTDFLCNLKYLEGVVGGGWWVLGLTVP